MWEAAENEVLRRRDAGLDGEHQEPSPADIGTVYSSDTVVLPYIRFIAGIANVAFHATLHIRGLYADTPWNDVHQAGQRDIVNMAMKIS
jgi:hypothetical protein